MSVTSTLQSLRAALFRRGRKVLYTGFTHRTVANWAPLFDHLQDQGIIVESVTFPRVADPDAAGLSRSPSRLRFPINADFTFEDAQSRPLDQTAELISRERYAAVFLTTAHVGPELQLMQCCKSLSHRPVFIGLQHGFDQHWPTYESHFDSYDLFGVFGEKFIERFDVSHRASVIPLGLPKLERIRARNDFAAGGLERDVLITLQAAGNADNYAILAEGLTRAGRRVVFRSHPEYPQLYDGLRARFTFMEADRPLVDALSDVSVLITTGSTSALEALEAGVRTVILPDSGGECYEDFRIVAKSIDVDDVFAILDRYDSSAFVANVRTQLAAYTGPSGHRLEQAVAALRARSII